MLTTSARQLFAHLIHIISGMYEPEEARSIVFLLLQHKLGLSKTTILSDKTIITLSAQDFNEWITRLLNHEPIQYILGETEFLGRTFLVNPSVLIPRPETEELVNWVLENTGTSTEKPYRILDIGTGSGCIAVSLAAASEAQVWAIDVSEAALAVARQNAERNQVTVHFRQVNFLTGHFPADFPPQFDCVVSNPPYVTLAEQSAMSANVLAHEPHIALFVSEEDTLVFYRHIARFCQQWLAPAGRYYLEINENLTQETTQLIQSLGLTTHIRKDMFGKDRMISGELTT